MIVAGYDYDAQPKAATVCPLCGRDNPSHPKTDRYGFRVGMSRCLQCAFVYLNPRMTAEAYATFYAEEHYRTLIEALSPAYQRSSMVPSQVTYGRELAAACPELKWLTGRLLDAGGSTGAVSRGWCEVQGVMGVTVLDPNPCELAQASDAALTIQGTLEDPAWLGGEWDLILCIQTIDHVRDPLVALKHLRASIKPGGWLVLDYVDVVQLSVRGIGHSVKPKIDHPCYWTAATMRWALTVTGWKIARLISNGQKGLVVCQPM